MHFLKKLLPAAALFATLTSASLLAQEPANRVSDLINRMTPEEKFWQLFMIPGTPDNADHDYSNGIFGLQLPPPPTAAEDAVQINKAQQYFTENTRLGIPIIPFEEALHGLKRPGATTFPQAIALAATWDTTLMRRVATAAARETRSRGIRQVLSPVVNIASDVRWGRTEETYGEDPHLVSAMTQAFVKPFEQAGIITTPKHFVANVADGGRDSWPVTLDKRTLAEIHYPPFKAAFDVGARSIMTAYNSVDGVPATQNRSLLTETLKKEWGFQGFVISDASATGGAEGLHLTEPDVPTAGASAWKAGLDVVFQSSWPQYTPYLAAFTRGLVPEQVMNSALTRVLTAKEQLGLFEDPFVDPDSAAYWNGHKSHLALARETAAASMVLLKNEQETLPLSADLTSVAVIGPDAVEARLGGYSGPAIAPVNMLGGLKDRFGASVRYLPGPGREAPEYVTVPEKNLALTASYFDNPELSGTPLVTKEESAVDVRWTFNRPASGLSTDWYSVRWEGTLSVGEDPVHKLGVEGDDGWRLYLDGELLIDNWKKQSYHTRLAEVDLEPGTHHDIKLEYFETTGNARVKLVWDAGESQDRRARIDSAAALAGQSDIAIIAAGIEEGEFRDRAYLGLPGRQEELIRAVAATGTPVVVVLVGGSAITMPWLDAVDAVLMAWYPGEQGGHAIADILLGDVNPSGRLPITFPMAEGQLPLVYNHRPTGRGNDYLDLTGKPLLPFGFGLSYTSFSYSNLNVSSDTIDVDETVKVRCTIRNTGTQAGHEVVQLYMHDLLASVARPVIELKGFTRVYLEPGEEQEVEFSLSPEELSLIDQGLNRVVEPGAFRIYIGTSSKDIRLRGEVTVQ